MNYQIQNENSSNGSGSDLYVSKNGSGKTKIFADENGRRLIRIKPCQRLFRQPLDELS